MRFLADMGVSLRVVEWLRLRRDDVVHLRFRPVVGRARADGGAEQGVVLRDDLGPRGGGQGEDESEQVAHAAFYTNCADQAISQTIAVPQAVSRMWPTATVPE